jgi:SAM-dependent methyltransferase
MEAFREGLRFRGLPDVRSAVLDDLSSYFQVDAEACVYRARHSRELSSEEWHQIGGDGRAAAPDHFLSDFFQHVNAYMFGLLWYAYLQAEGLAYPVSVVIARDLRHRQPGPVLDFGAGVGATAQLFGQLGWEPSLADISTPLLEFARFRLERRGQRASYVDLSKETLSSNEYSVITAVQVLASVPDIPQTAASLHHALSPGGLLYADVDANERQADVRLYDDDLAPRRAVLRAGFVQERALDGESVRYRRAASSGPLHAMRGLRDGLALGQARSLWRRLRHTS